jgi:hypothetical protein
MGCVLRQHGVCHALINFGESSLLAIGPMLDGRAWPIRVRNLDGTVSGEAIAIQDQSVSSSASFSQTYTVAGQLLSLSSTPGAGARHLLAWLAFWGGYGGMLIATLWEMWGPSAEMLPPIGSSGQG